MIPRRRLLAALSSALLIAPSAVRARRPGEPYRVGVLGGEPGDPPGVPVRPQWKAFIDELAQRGYVVGSNLVLERRYAGSDRQRLPELARELAALEVDVIFTHSGSGAAFAAKQATSTIPIVMELVGDPVARGLVASLARPGGNITGNAFFVKDLGLKRVQILAEAADKPTRIAFLRYRPDRSTRDSSEYEAAMLRAATEAGATFAVADYASAEELAPAFEQMRRDGVNALAVDHTAFSTLRENISRISALVARDRLAAIADGRHYAEAGFLITYSVDYVALFKAAAASVDKILKGAKPADLPVQLPSKFEMIVNLKTAQALGIRLSQAILLRADEVIR